jgi:hypothetical protein
VVYQNPGLKAAYGFPNFTYMDMTCLMDRDVDSGGVAALLTTKNWYYGGYDRPRSKPRRGKFGTDSDEIVYTEWAGVGCGHWDAQAFLTGITS